MTPKALKKILETHADYLKTGDQSKRANLYGANLYGANLKDANLTGAHLTRANLKDANLEGAYLKDANLKDANLYGANLKDANLTGAYLTNANLTGANLTDANLYCANLTSANLTNANLEGANLTGAHLTRANLTGANLYGAYLERANLTNANLEGAYLANANLYGANLTGAKLPAFQIPQEGDLIVWKKLAGGCVLKLKVIGPRTASLIGRKCRAKSVLPLVAYKIRADGKPGRPAPKTALLQAMHDNSVYEIGKIRTEPKYDPDPRVECTPGLHFFLTREEAEAY